MKYSDYRSGGVVTTAFSISFFPIIAAMALRIIQLNEALCNTRRFKKKIIPLNAARRDLAADARGSSWPQLS